MNNDTRYFRVTGGAVRASYERFVALRQRQLSARSIEQAKYGATGLFANNKSIEGLLFQDEGDVKSGPVPEGWTLLGTHNVWAPSKRTKQGRAIHAEWKKFCIAGAREFQAEVLGFNDVFYFMDSSMRVRFMGYECVDGDLILCVPRVVLSKTEEQGASTGDGCKWQPPDEGCREIKTSEYWKLKEGAKPAFE